jgi:hypothetical protein
MGDENESFPCPESTVESADQRNKPLDRKSSELAEIRNNSRSNSSVPCESTIESANRRNFIRKAAMVTAAAAVGSTVLGGKMVPESSAKTAACSCLSSPHAVYVDTSCSCNGNPCLAPYQGAFFGSNLCVFPPGEGIGSQRNCCTEKYFCACLPPGHNLHGLDFYTDYKKRMSITHAGNVGIGTCTPHATLCVVGNSFCSMGVFGYSCNSVGVSGESCLNVGVKGCGLIGVQGLARCASSIPIVAQGVSSQTAPLQQWKKGTAVKSVVNKCGWLGLGAASASTTLHVNGSFSARQISVTSTYTMDPAGEPPDFAVFGNASSKAFTVTLPAAASADGRIVLIKKTDSTANAITVSAASGDSIEGKTTRALTKQYDSLQLISNGAHEWFLVGNSLGDAFVS